MKFWDSSALVPLFIDEPTTSTMRQLATFDGGHVVWWAAATECVSAFSRRLRLGHLDQAGHDAAMARLGQARDRWSEIPPSQSLRRDAERLLQALPLRAADAFQLAAALEAGRAAPQPVAFVCLDERLRDAARSEGFIVEP